MQLYCCTVHALNHSNYRFRSFDVNFDTHNGNLHLTYLFWGLWFQIWGDPKSGQISRGRPFWGSGSKGQPDWSRFDGWKPDLIKGIKANHDITKFRTFCPKWKVHAMTALHDSISDIIIQHMTSTWRSDSTMQAAPILLFWPVGHVLEWCIRPLGEVLALKPSIHSSRWRLILALSALEGWHITGLDVKNAFLYGELDEEIYMKRPEGYCIKGQEHRVWCLLKALYGLKQAALVWWKALSQSMKVLGYTCLTTDAGGFVCQLDDGTIFWPLSTLMTLSSLVPTRTFSARRKLSSWLNGNAGI